MTEFFVTLEKDPQQEDFLQGRMPGNPYSSNEPGIGPLMRDIKNKICQDCDLVALLEDDSGMEVKLHLLASLFYFSFPSSSYLKYNFLFCCHLLSNSSVVHVILKAERLIQIFDTTLFSSAFGKQQNHKPGSVSSRSLQEGLVPYK